MKQFIFLFFLFVRFQEVQSTSLHNAESIRIPQEISNKPGIKWTEGLTWEQIKEKAKKENKFIFIDCFATWCKPCKMMDKYVYLNDTIGAFFNRHFISIKVQTDKNKNDDDFIQKWYKDAEKIILKYKVETVPTFIFLSPRGEIVYKKSGYSSVNDFLAIARIATKPGEVYEDPHTEYYRLVEEYRHGRKNYDRMAYMIKTAIQQHDDSLSMQMLTDYTNYAASLPSKERYTLENITLFAKGVVKSKEKRFIFFYRDGKIIDRVMNKKGYSESVIDRCIKNEIVTPFWENQPSGNVMKGKYNSISTKKDLKVDCAEANWKVLFNLIRKKYNKSYAKRNVLDARMQWYYRHNNMDSFISCFSEKYNFNGKDSLTVDEGWWINFYCWNIFMKVTDEKLLAKVIPWMEKLVVQYPIYTSWLDTYASLLYKSGQKEKAIQWEEKALINEKRVMYKDLFRMVIEQMKKDEPIHGAIWK